MRHARRGHTRSRAASLSGAETRGEEEERRGLTFEALARADGEAKKQALQVCKGSLSAKAPLQMPEE